MKPIYRNVGRLVAVALAGIGLITEEQLGKVAETVAESAALIMLVVIEMQSWFSKLKKKEEQ